MKPALFSIPRAPVATLALSVALGPLACAPATQTAVHAPAPHAAPAAPAHTSAAAVSHAPPGPKASAQVVNLTLAESGLEAASLDQSAAPCDDFYRFACGGWMSSHPIPDDHARWGRFAELHERNEAVLRQILEDASAGKAAQDPVMGKLGALYASCMDEAGVERAGLSAVKPYLDDAQRVRDPKSLFKAVLALHQADLNVLFTRQTLADFKDSTTNVLFLDSGGLGLPDRDYYLQDAFKKERDAYREHAVRVFSLLGRDAKSAEAAASDALALETELAKITRTAVERRDVPKMYNPVDMAGLSTLAPSFNWEAYFKGLELPKQGKMVVTTPEFLQGMDKLFSSAPPQQWAHYLTLRIVDETAETLPKKFDDELFKLKQVLSGVETQRERAKRCIDAVSAAMPEYLGQPYVERMFPGDSKKTAQELVGAIATAMGQELARLDWMSEPTKVAARDKLDKIVPMLGFPDTWKSYDFAVDKKRYAKNMLAARGFEAKRQLAKAGKPCDRSEWLMGAFEVNAYYNPLANNTALPAGILQPPFFGEKRSVAANLGGIGMVIGHELTHGFDDQGAQFDAQGNMRNWWQPNDLTQFRDKGQCVSKQYADLEVLPGRKLNGELTLGENIADMGGVKMAFYAYRTLRSGADQTYVAEGFSEDQQFFLGVAQAWCSLEREPEAIRRLTTDPHSPPRFRVLGAMRNLPEFASAFSCEAGTRYRADNVCTVW